MPPFAKDGLSNKYASTNARDDKLKKSRGMWKPLFEKQRCIVPVSAFYEHHTLSKPQLIAGAEKETNKVPFRISLKSSDIFCFAGIYNKWTDKETGEEILTHAIVTTDPNETVGKIHNSRQRMVVILPETAYTTWLEPIDKADDLFDAGLIQPWPDEDMEYFQISKAFDYGASDEDLLRPVKNPIEV